ncbi:MAG TPA: 23S rRNA (uracil(1939)-C(5))-methyltransferase RlmD, partial [Cyclobacteriaceae bacterium]|nr:23S rRNA (uracil(1939)-C(5))-methyltransferase RlmD [Cyclobacteriaceae bacterium]
MKKGDQLDDLYIESMAAEGKCLAKVEGKVVFVADVAPGDRIKAQVTKVKSRYADAKMLELITPSSHRLVPFCNHYNICGGCKWQHVDYQTQLQFKQQQVIDNLERIGGLNLPQVSPILASSKTSHYRNKLDFTFSNRTWLTHDDLKSGKSNQQETLGFHVPGMFDKVFQVEECHLQPEPSNQIRNLIYHFCIENRFPFFDLRTQEGFMRTLTIRTTNMGEVMIIVQFAYEQQDWIKQLMTYITTAVPAINSANYIINTKRNDTFGDLEVICFKGRPYITEQMSAADDNGKLQFRIGPKSFYQTNADQAYELYRAAWQMAAFKDDELVYDLYTGTGTIANFVARHVKHVVGLEYVAEAIEDAKINSEINQIHNTSFFAGDIKDLL